MKTKKNANDVHLQCQRVLAFLNLYLHCISVGKIRQCIDASSVRLWPCKIRLYPPHSRPPPPPCHFITRQALRWSLRQQLRVRWAVVCFQRLMLTISDKLTLGGFSVSGLPTSRRHNRMNKLFEMHACLRVLKDTGFVFFTAQCTLVHMRGLGIACRPSVRPSVRL